MTQDQVYSLITALGTFGLFGVSFVALKSWRKEKNYDLIIDSLEFAFEAEQFLKYLRSPFSNGEELTAELKERFKEAGNKNYTYYIFQSRMTKRAGTYERLWQLYLRNRANEGDKGEMTKFFKAIIDFIKKIEISYVRLSIALEDKETNPTLLEAVHKEVDGIIFVVSEDDIYEKQFAASRDRLETLYRKRL